MKKILFILLLIVSSLCAKEPNGILLGVGVGEGRSEMSIEHPHIAKYPLQDVRNSPLFGTNLWTAQTDSATGSWALLWEVLFGYKHFVNDYIGFRYYANVSVQHYKPVTFKSKKDPIGYIDYTAQLDLLLNFYTSEGFAFGVLGGVGLGGMSLDKKAIHEYENIYNTTSGGGIPIGASDITKHFVSLNFSAGVRMIFFQKVGDSSGGVRNCDSYYKGKKRSCSATSSYVGHNFEAVVKFPTLTYNATTPDFVMAAGATNTNANLRSRPAYKIKNPYKITFRYVLEF